MFSKQRPIKATPTAPKARGKKIKGTGINPDPGGAHRAGRDELQR
jgi:hypothetical protein